MSVTVTLVLCVTAVSYVVADGQYGDPCEKMESCVQKHTYCATIAAGCQQRTCICIPGFFNYQGQCLLERRLSEDCSEIAPCRGSYVECVGDTCECAFGYKAGKKNDCIPQLQSKEAGDLCHDTAQCYYSLVCIDNTCGCYPGYVLSSDRVSCVERGALDRCQDDRDCAQAPNTQCVNAKCDCIPGYKPGEYRTMLGEVSTMCIREANSIKVHGEDCDYTSRDNPALCDSTTWCTWCGNSTSRCTIPLPVSGLAPTHTLVSSLLLVVLLLFC